MKKTLTPLLIAAAVALSACGQDLSGGDWRATGVVQAAGIISRSGADTDVLVCVHEGDAVFYRDSADQELFGQVVYPMDVQDPWDTFAAIDFADRNGDGDGDVAMTFTDSEGGDVWMVWFWDADTESYVFQPEESQVADFADEGTDHLGFEGTWYLDGDETEDSVIIIGAVGDWVLYDQQGDTRTAIDSGLLRLVDEAQGHYAADSEQFDDVSYLIATAGENGMYWGVTGDYDYYERLD